MDAVQEYAVDTVEAALLRSRPSGDSSPARLDTVVDNILDTLQILQKEHPHSIFCVASCWFALKDEQRGRLQHGLKSLFSVFADDSTRQLASFVLFSAVFWSIAPQFFEFLAPGMKIRINRSWIKQHCLNGMGGERVSGQASLDDLDFDKVEEHFIPGPGQARHEHDRIFSAIQETVLEHGLAGATVQQIAERIGISVSSLYFYFSNRDEMLQKTVENERQAFLDLLKPRLESFSGNCLEAAYGFYLVLDSFYRNNPELITVEHWLRNQSSMVENPPEPPSPGPEIFELFSRCISEGWFGTDSNVFAILVFLHILTAHDHHFHLAGQAGNQMNNQKDTTATLRQRFGLFLFGTQWPAISQKINIKPNTLDKGVNL